MVADHCRVNETNHEVQPKQKHIYLNNQTRHTFDTFDSYLKQVNTSAKNILYIHCLFFIIIKQDNGKNIIGYA